MWYMYKYIPCDFVLQWRGTVWQGHLDEKEEEVLQHEVTNAEMMIAYHPNLEELPELSVVLEKIEFLHELTPDQRQR